jgi:hypothetical protein
LLQDAQYGALSSHTGFTGAETSHNPNRTMTRTPSTRTVLKTLREAGFPMDAIIEQGRGTVEIGYLTEGRVQWSDRERTHQAAEVASELLGWGWWGTGYGSCIVDFNHRYDDPTRELIRNNMD